jgi:glycerol-3-phosphate cytidylyltransferase
MTRLMIPPSDEPEHADEILSLLHKACAELDITYFVYAGTALGFYRDGTYIHKDNDLDVGIISAPEKFMALSDYLENQLGFTVDGVNHYWMHNMLLDIRGGTDYWGPEEALQRCVIPFTEQLDAVSYKGRAYSLPHPIEQHLACLYGPNWGTPHPKAGQKVFAIVTCDILHIGHIRWLEKAAELGNYLIVGLRTDEFVAQDKGHRPIIPYEQRKELLEGLRCVDYVEPFSAPDDFSAVEERSLTTCVIDDSFPEYPWEIEMRRALEAKGLQFITIERTPNVSTTQIKQACCRSLLGCSPAACGMSVCGGTPSLCHPAG